MRNKLERWLDRFAVPHLTVLFTVLLTITYGLRLLWPGTADAPSPIWSLVFSRDAILAGEIWRVVTFMFVAPGWHPIFAAFGLYLFYLMGTALEHEWGEARFNLFVLVGFFATVLVGFLGPYGIATNQFLLGSVFLAFAYLYPDFEIMLFFLLPVKIKWLALLTWLGYGYSLITGGWTERFLVLAAVANFFLFFGRQIVQGAQAAKRRMEFKAHNLADNAEPFHACAECGISETTHPDAEFRVCDECSAGQEYCLDHVDQHQHR